MDSSRRNDRLASDSRVSAGDPPRLQTRDARVRLLVEAFGARDLSALTQLADAEVDINAIDLDGRSCLMHAAEAGDSDAVRWMLEAGAGADVRAPEGRTAIHFAAVNGHLATVARLLESGADSALVDRAGRTAAELARLAGHEETRILLVEWGRSADPSSRSADYRSGRPEPPESRRVTSAHSAVASRCEEAREIPVSAMGLGSAWRAPWTLVLIESNTGSSSAVKEPLWAVEERAEWATSMHAAELSKRLGTDTLFLDYLGEDCGVRYLRFRKGIQVESFSDDPEEYSEDKPDDRGHDEELVADDPIDWLNRRLEALGARYALSSWVCPTDFG